MSAKVSLTFVRARVDIARAAGRQVRLVLEQTLPWGRRLRITLGQFAIDALSEGCKTWVRLLLRQSAFHLLKAHMSLHQRPDRVAAFDRLLKALLQQRFRLNHAVTGNIDVRVKGEDFLHRLNPT